MSPEIVLHIAAERASQALGRGPGIGELGHDARVALIVIYRDLMTLTGTEEKARAWMWAPHVKFGCEPIMLGLRRGSQQALCEIAAYLEGVLFRAC